jgi:hypothetical protein
LPREEEKRQNLTREASLGNHCGQAQQSRLELGCVSAIDSNGRTIWIVDGHRDNGKRFVARGDELTAFLELERVRHQLAVSAVLGDDTA